MAKACQKRVVVVTGGSRGIGAKLVERFKEEGWTVATCSRQVPARTPADLFTPCDIRDERQVADFIAEIVQRWQKIDVVINNPC